MFGLKKAKEKNRGTRKKVESIPLDISIVFMKLSGLSHPLAIQRGAEAIYKDLKEVIALFEADKFFMASIKNK